MPAGHPNFRDDYQVDPSLEDKIRDTNYDDQNNPGFFPRYRVWISDGRPSSHEELATYFSGFQRCRTALNLGDRNVYGARAAGQVRIDNAKPDDFDIINGFVASAPNAISEETLRAAAIEGVPAIPNPTDEILFEVALRRFLNGEQLQGYELGLVNGSIVAVARLSTAFEEKGAAPRSEEAIFAIPGSVVFPWRRSLGDAFWRGISEKMEEAFTTTGARLINLSGAIQIRTGARPFPPIKVGSGMVIMGGT